MYATACSRKNVQDLPFWCLRPRYENSVQVLVEVFQEKTIQLFKTEFMLKNEDITSE